jgi:hypothetical protein
MCDFRYHKLIVFDLSQDLDAAIGLALRQRHSQDTSR